MSVGGKMDSLDTQIFGLIIHGGGGEFPFQSDFRKPFRAIARDLGVDEGTVRNRVRRFEETGFIKEWWTWVNPRLWGGGHAGLWMDVPPTISKEELMERMKLIPGADVITRFYPSMITAWIRYTEEESLRKRVDLMRRLAEADRFGFGDVIYPPCDLDLSRSDLQVLRAVEENPRKPYTVLAEEIGLSVRTVRRKLRRLIEGFAAFAFADIDVSAVRGAVMASVMVICPEEEQERIAPKVAGYLESYLWHMFQTRPFDDGEDMSCVFDLIIPNLSKGREMLKWIQDVPGVTESRIDLFEEIIASPMRSSRLGERLASER